LYNRFIFKKPRPDRFSLQKKPNGQSNYPGSCDFNNVDKPVWS
jgi:hypothetical protein